MRLTKKINLFEEFQAEVLNTQKPKVNEVPINKIVNVKPKGVIKTDALKDVDSILNNLEQLSAQITESTLITEAEALDAVFKSIKSVWAVAKATSMLKKFGELYKNQNPDLLVLKSSVLAHKAKGEITKAGEDSSAEGKARAAKLKAKLSIAMDKLESGLELEKEKSKNELDAFNVDLADVETNIAKDSALGKVYFATKMKVQADVRELGKTELAKQKMKEGNDKAAKELADDIKDIKKQSEDLAQKIADGNSEAGKDTKELEGIKAYIPEIDAIQKANQALATIRAEAEEAREAVVAESNIFGFDVETILESTLTDLYSASKSRANVAGLTKTKELAAKFKQAGTAKIEAQRALADKIKGKEVTKTVIIIAGGDGDAAKEGENGYTLTTFIKSLGGGTDIIPTEEFTIVKDAIEVEGEVDDAIAQAESGGGSGETEKSAEEVAKDALGDEFNNYSKITDPEEEVEDTDDEGNTTTKKKWKDVKIYKGKDAEGADTTEEVVYAKLNESIRTLNKPKLYEGMSIAAKFKALM